MEKRIQKVYILMGLPGAGKTTWAEALAEQNDKIAIISRDDIRYMLSHSYRYNKDRWHQALVQKTSNDMTYSAMAFGFDIVLDRLSLTREQREKTVKEIRYVAGTLMMEVEVHIVHCTEDKENVKRRMNSDMRWGDEAYYEKLISDMKEQVEVVQCGEDFDFLYLVDKNGEIYESHKKSLEENLDDKDTIAK
jgi:adenylate kinase family enzyme